jgi:hypothetical protein
VFALIAGGEAHRHVGSTDMNQHSSRSHTIFRLVVESKLRSTDQDDYDSSPVRSSTLSLVDLAGSESVKQSNTSGHRRKEWQYINKCVPPPPPTTFVLNILRTVPSSPPPQIPAHSRARDLEAVGDLSQEPDGRGSTEVPNADGSRAHPVPRLQAHEAPAA